MSDLFSWLFFGPVPWRTQLIGAAVCLAIAVLVTAWNKIPGWEAKK